MDSPALTGGLAGRGCDQLQLCAYEAQPDPLWSGWNRKDPSGHCSGRCSLRGWLGDQVLYCGNLEKLLQSIDRAELVILDEWGYLPLEKEQAQLLFQLISSCYERRSLIITTNLEFSK